MALEASAIARAVGAQRNDDADALVLHALVLAVALGLAFTVAELLAGRLLYSALGGRGGVLDASPVFAGTLRLVIAAGVGWCVVAWFGGSLSTLFLVVAASAVAYGVITAIAVRLPMLQ